MQRTLITASASLTLLVSVSMAQAQSLPSYAETTPPVVKQPAPKAKELTKVSPSSSKSETQVPKIAEVRKKAPELPPPAKVTQDFYNAVKARNLDLAEMLLQQGPDINCMNCGDAPLLNWAAAGQFVGVAPPRLIEWLLARGANPNVRDPSTGNTPLHKVILNALEFTKWSRELDDFDGPIRNLIERGARADIQNVNGDSPLHFVARFVHYAHNPSITQFANRNLDRFLQAGGRIDQTNAAGLTPLMNGLRVDLSRQVICNPVVIQHLMDMGSDLRAKDKKGRTPYTFAYDLAVEGFKQCNPVLDILASGKPANPTPSAKAPDPVNKPVVLPEGLAGEYTGVLRVKSPSAMTLAVSGSIRADGSVLLNAPRGFTNVGYLASASKEALEFRLKTRAPEGYKFANGQQETAEFSVKGRVSDRIFQGQYEAPTDSGEFVLCPNDIAQAHAECRPSFAESLNSALGGLLGGK